MIIKSNRKIILAIIFILILIVIGLLIGRFTYSYLGANIPDNLTGSGELTASGDTIIFSSDNKLSIMATTDNFNSASAASRRRRQSTSVISSARTGRSQTQQK